MSLPETNLTTPEEHRGSGSVGDITPIWIQLRRSIRTWMKYSIVPSALSTTHPGTSPLAEQYQSIETERVY
jgi:hypothetical protein